MRDASFDIAFVEETFGLYTDHGTGHLDLTTFPIALDQLREVGAVTPRTAVVAVHLSHHNPPGDALSGQLSQWGARTVADGTQLTIGTSTFVSQVKTTANTSPTTAPDRSTKVLITGGARSGKSSRAESLLAERADVRYIATSGSRPDDAEWAQRVAIHQQRRPHTWQTIETCDLVGELAKDDARPVLIDCLSLWLAAVMDEHQVWGTAPGTPHRQTALDHINEDIAELVNAVGKARCDTLIVTNEVGSGIVPEHESGRLFRDILGRLNAQVAVSCERVELVVAGRVITL